jgi:hypothetical protein
MSRKTFIVPVAVAVAVGAGACSESPTGLGPIAPSFSLVESSTPTVTITNPTGDLTFGSFPQTQAVAVTVARLFTSPSAAGNRNLCGVKQFKLFIGDTSLDVETDTPVYAVNGDLAATVGSGSDQDCPTTSRNFSYDWSITEPGVYKIVATVQTTGASGATGEDELTLEVFEETVIVSHPAAPAVAAEILKQYGVSHRYGSGRTGGNHISDVAAEMSSAPGTDFQGVAKADVAAYRCAIQNFLATKANPADGVPACGS